MPIEKPTPEDQRRIKALVPGTTAWFGKDNPRHIAGLKCVVMGDTRNGRVMVRVVDGQPYGGERFTIGKLLLTTDNPHAPK